LVIFYVANKIVSTSIDTNTQTETTAKAATARANYKHTDNMQCGVETMNDCERSPGRTGLRVNFTEKGEVKERREKFLTAKYGSHQMSLIRKRLAVEMWLYDELQKLFDPPVIEIYSLQLIYSRKNGKRSICLSICCVTDPFILVSQLIELIKRMLTLTLSIYIYNTQSKKGNWMTVDMWDNYE
jgi:hypothetical protein